MNYATIPETGWTQRDWEGMTYTYQIEEVDTPAFDGVTYDKTKYTVTVTLEDDGQGHLTPKAEISGGEDGSIVLKNELARRDLTISKTTAGNAVLSDDAFTVKIRLSRNDIVPVDGDYPMDGAAETTLTVKNGEATLTLCINRSNGKYRSYAGLHATHKTIAKLQADARKRGRARIELPPISWTRK